MNSHNASKPLGGANVRRVRKPPEPNDHLLEQVLSRANMQTAWKRVKANKGAPGVDGMAIDQFQTYARKGWPKIRNALEAGNYQPKPVKRVDIPKPSGGVRPLAIAQMLVPIFDPDFSEHSYGFRPGRSAHDAVRKVRDHIKEGYRWAVDMDLEKFFGTVNHDVLMHRSARKVRDKQLLKLIRKYLRSAGAW